MKKYLLLALGLLATGAAQGAVSLTFSDAIGLPGSVTISPGESFSVTLTLTSTAEATAGLTYFLETTGSASSQFTITARDVTGSAFPDLTTENGIALSPANGVLDPVNSNDLGGQVALTPNGIGSFAVATLTIQSLPGLAPGTYTVSTNSAVAFNEALDEIPVNQPSYSVTVVPEPGSAMLLGLGLAAAMIRRRR